MRSDPYPAHGDLRIPLVLARRVQLPADDDAAIVEQDKVVGRVWAKLEQARPLTYYSAQQTETPFTHVITCRYLSGIDTSYVLLRQRRLPDGRVVTERYRVRRTTDINGRSRFLAIEAELEQVHGGSDDQDEGPG